MSRRRCSALRLPASLEIERECRDIAKVLDRLLGPREAELAGIEPERLGRGRREQREALPGRRGSPGPLEEAMDDDDVGPGELIAAGDLRPDVRAVVDEQLEVEPRRQRHELQSQLVAWSMLRSRRRNARYEASSASTSSGPSARPSSTHRKAASPSNLASRNGGSRRPTIVSSRSPAIVGACSISLPDRYAV